MKENSIGYSSINSINNNNNTTSVLSTRQSKRFWVSKFDNESIKTPIISY